MANGLEEKIKLLGFIPNGYELNKVYQHHDFFVNPSLSETGPRVIIEAMMNNLYCISTDVGYVSKVLTTSDGVLFGSIIKEKNKSSLIRELNHCIRNKDNLIALANRYGKEATKYTLDAFILDEIRILKGYK